MAISTIKAVICFLPFLSGVRAITIIVLAFTPFVHHNLVPLIIKCSPSSVGSATVSNLAGSDPTGSSVKAKAEISFQGELSGG